MSMCDCGECRACKERARRKANPERYREVDRKRYYRDREKRLAGHKKWRAANKTRAYEISRKTLAKVEEIKTASPCLDCKNFYPPECMDFDHLDPTTKVASVGHMIACRWSWVKIEVEMAKCELVCANCHRIRTKRRLKDKRPANANV
jgi:hypothetical protein